MTLCHSPACCTGVHLGPSQFFLLFHPFCHVDLCWSSDGLCIRRPVSCDFQAQQSNLVQVARTLGRAVPLSPQLIFTPTATVAAVQPEGTTPTTQPSTTTAQVSDTLSHHSSVLASSPLDSSCPVALHLPALPLLPSPLIENGSRRKIYLTI